ncbi:MAG: NAD-dependent epimerase/dehydratase family protein [Deltaproteobacteria bacterium]|nr:NAD-dependent epimerase/dehydratase family protein [Deltaproteobacteria bacterium]
MTQLPEILKNTRVVITGGAGFIGSQLAARLSADPSIHVTLFDNLHRDAITGTELLRRPNVQFVQGDVRDVAAVRQALTGAHHIVHMASIAGVDTVMKMPVATMLVSMQGTMNVLEVAHQLREAGQDVRRVVDFSTSEVFGQYAFQVAETDTTALGAVGEARWTYAVAKLATEHLAANYHKQYGLPTAAIRPFNVYGPQQVGTGAIHHFVRNALAGATLQVHNDGAQIRSWCFIDDLIAGVLAILSRPEAVGQSFNLGNPRSTVTIWQLARDIVRLCGSPSEIRFVPWNFADVELRVPDITKARELLGFEPRVDLEEGLARTIDWYREQNLGAAKNSTHSA